MTNLNRTDHSISTNRWKEGSLRNYTKDQITPDGGIFPMDDPTKDKPNGTYSRKNKNSIGDRD